MFKKESLRLLCAAAIVTSSVLVSSCYVKVNKQGNGDTIFASGETVDTTIALPMFKSLRLDNSLDVDYVYSADVICAKIEAKENILPLIKPVVEDGVLSFRLEANSVQLGGVNIRIQGPVLASVALTGSGDITLGDMPGRDISLSLTGSGDIEAFLPSYKNVNIDLSGSGDIDVKGIDSASLVCVLQGSGDISVEGRSLNAVYNLIGSGDIDARKLTATNVSTGKLGSGDIKYKM